MALHKPNDPSIVHQGSGGILSRPMRPEDLPQVMEIENLSFSSPWSHSSFLQEFNNPVSRTLVAESDGRVRGYLCCWCVADEVHTLNLAVHPNYRRLGIARRLMEEVLLEARAEGIKTVSLEVRRSNLPAVSLYHRLGFRQVGVRRRYYENGEDAFLMACFLRNDAGL